MADLKGDAQAKVGRGEPIKSPLFGNGDVGKGWADGEYLGIKKITAIDDSISTGFQLDYINKDGSVFHGKAHGSTKQQFAKYFDIKYPSEVLQKITGYYGKDHEIDKIKYLLFTKNTGESLAVGAFAPTDTKFEIPDSKIPVSDIVGLFGTADDDYVYSFGAYYYAD